jgi:hypothetical protein
MVFYIKREYNVLINKNVMSNAGGVPEKTIAVRGGASGESKKRHEEYHGPKTGFIKDSY